LLLLLLFRCNCTGVVVPAGNSKCLL
jgi:hypothetical protein